MAQGIVEGGDVWYGEHRLQEGQLEIRISRNRHLRLFIGVEKSLVLLLGESACDSILFSGLNVLNNPPDPCWQHRASEEERGGFCCNSFSWIF